MIIDPLILHSILFLGGLGFILGIGLGSISQKHFSNPDLRRERLFKLLPGTNCGACGFSGCSAYSSALLNNETETDKCTSLKHGNKLEISKLLGIPEKSSERKTAVIFCAGGRECKNKIDYRGIKSCSMTLLEFGGNKACSRGCLGFDDCITACRFGAIAKKTKGDVPVIDTNKCIACGDCVNACPNGLIQLVPDKFNYHILCRTQDRVTDVKNFCSIGCIGCGICVKTCPKKDILIEENLAYMKYKECDNCGLCAQKCPTKSISFIKPAVVSTNFINSVD
ncbi:MAG: 4Fe-4S binding protein [Elusimicrobia bacterium]|nr:4Fe-4S binding protein [Candidatus Liberimonas magnetica]